jgi:hypothetical protein
MGLGFPQAEEMSALPLQMLQDPILLLRWAGRSYPRSPGIVTVTIEEGVGAYLQRRRQSRAPVVEVLAVRPRAATKTERRRSKAKGRRSGGGGPPRGEPAAPAAVAIVLRHASRADKSRGLCRNSVEWWCPAGLPTLHIQLIAELIDPEA